MKLIAENQEVNNISCKNILGMNIPGMIIPAFASGREHWLGYHNAAMAAVVRVPQVGDFTKFTDPGIKKIDEELSR
jgi:hypothetical protein